MIPKPPSRFWSAYAAVLVYVGVTAWAVSSLAAWYYLPIALLSAFAIFVLMRIAYRVGLLVAYEQASAWLEEARRSMVEGQGELQEAMQRLDTLSDRFQGPS